MKIVFIFSILFLSCAEKRKVEFDTSQRFGIVEFKKDIDGNFFYADDDSFLIFLVLIIIIYGVYEISNYDTDPSKYEKLISNNENEKLKKYLFYIDKNLQLKYPNYISIENLKIDEVLEKRMSLKEKFKFFIEKNSLSFGLSFNIYNENIYWKVFDENGTLIKNSEKFEFNQTF